MTYLPFYGMQREDQALRSRYFQDYEFKGVFLDVGAGHPVTINNGYHFRMNGWGVYSIEPNPRLAELYRQMDFAIVECVVASLEKVNACGGVIAFDSYTNDSGWGGNVSDYEIPQIILDKIEAGQVSIDKSRMEVIEVQCRTLDDILENEWKDIGHIDIMDMDIELYDASALKGFDLVNYQPTIMLVEDHDPPTSGIPEWMEHYGYRLDHTETVSKFYVRE